MRNGETSGKYNEAGAPGISGTFTDLAVGADGLLTMGNATGAFRVPANVGLTVQKASTREVLAQSGDGIAFNASWSSTVYSASDTIMPASADMIVALYLGRTA